MTDLSRGARVRRGGRRPGWLLLTALLVLAIGASSALVFTNQVELLKLAVILALWAAVVAAFVSVIYRRQSDVDQARARDLKLVYDLQLDREISARREYELTVESQLRRELASELRAQAADEVSELRAELAALRTNLEILFDAELSDRPALETERRTVRGYSEWDRENESARERVNRVASVRAEEPPGAPTTVDHRRARGAAGPTPPRQPVTEQLPAGVRLPARRRVAPPGPNRAAEAHETPEADRGWAAPATEETRAATRRGGATRGLGPPPRRSRAREPPARSGSRRAATGPRRSVPPQHRRLGRVGAVARKRGGAIRAQPLATFTPPARAASAARAAVRPAAPQPEPPPQQQRPGWPPPAEGPRHQEQPDWQPVSADGQWSARRSARQPLEFRSARQRRLGVVGVRQRAVTRQAVAPLTEHRRIRADAAV